MMRMRKLEKDGKLEERMVRRPILNHTHRVDGSRSESLLVSNWTETLRLRLTWMGARENLGEETGKLTGQKRRLRPRSSVSRSTFLLFVRQDLFLSLFKFFLSLQVFFLSFSPSFLSFFFRTAKFLSPLRMVPVTEYLIFLFMILQKSSTSLELRVTSHSALHYFSSAQSFKKRSDLI